MQKFTACLILFFCALLQAAGAQLAGSNVKASIKSDVHELTPSQEFGASVILDIPAKSHIYYKTAPETGLPTELAFNLPQGFKLLAEAWPEPQKFKDPAGDYEGYKGVIIIKARIKAADALPKGFSKIDAHLSWLECSDLCAPGEAQLSLIIKNAAAGGAETAQESAKEGGILGLIFGAFLGGLILNLMPCVFPVIGLKILGFVKSAGQSRIKILTHAGLYSAGIVGSFWTLALALIFLKSAGTGLGWGFQLQEPGFVAFLIMLFFILSLSFAGVFEMGASLAGLGFKADAAAKDGKNPYASSFLSGVLAVVVASPCTAPFMGSALGAALADGAGAGKAIAIFTALGIGMALPYVLLSMFPKLLNKLPKSGAWLETFKQILAFPLLATVIWLIWVFTLQTSANAAALILFALLAAAFGLWAWGKWGLPHFNFRTRLFAGLTAALFLIAAGALAFKAAGGATAENKDLSAQSATADAWSKEKEAALLKEGKNVYVDFTASWCLTCQANKIALHSDAVKTLFAKKNIVVLVGDWTKRDKSISEVLKTFGRASVPLNLIYSAKAPLKPVVLPAVLTPENIIEAIDKAGL